MTGPEDPPADLPPLVEQLAALADRAFEAGEFEVHALPVGSGQATLVRTAESTLLFDGGPKEGTSKPAGPYDGDAALMALEALGVKQLDHVVVSHLDTDHIAGLAPVLDRYGKAPESDDEKSLGAVHTPIPGEGAKLSQTAHRVLGCAERALGAPTGLVGGRTARPHRERVVVGARQPLGDRLA